jgi:hypothetical protein
MICRERVGELVECARRPSEPGPELRAHLAGCRDCRNRWEAENELAAALRVMRDRAAARREPNWRREVLMDEFARTQRHAPVRPWVWTFAAAAALISAVFIGHELGVRQRPAPVPASLTTPGEGDRAAVLYEASLDASALSGDDFVAVPYAPPLAPGELVRVVDADLYPGALASMGFDVDPAWASDFSAEVVVGGDGLPRAVRITGNGQF